MIGRLNNNNSAGDMVHSMSYIFGAVAKAAGLRGEWTLARKYSKLCLEAIATESTVAPSIITEADAEDDKDDGDINDISSRKRLQSGQQTAVGGKRAWRDMDLAREHSLNVCISFIPLTNMSTLTSITFYCKIGVP